MSKMRSYMGFAKRSGNLVAGTGTAITYMNRRKVKLLIICSDISENSKKKLIGTASKTDTKYVIYGDSEEISGYLGGGYKGVFAILDNHFARMIEKEIDGEMSIEKEVF